MSLLRNGVEIERAELGRDTIVNAGFGSVTANSTQLVRLYFRLNASNFTSVTMTLGLTDSRDGRAFTAEIPFSSFSSVTSSVVPARAHGD
jgi:hypothetical protein